MASDGHTFYGNVFGGGSGKDPYKAGKWHRKAGYVGGNTEVNITGGHILTSVYGGNEMTDVGSGDDLKVVSGKGKCTINMTGGTLGVPREDGDATDHPVTCYLFGAGKGDQRIFFNTWTNVSDTEVNVTGSARIFGSVFGGGEDGHILRNAAVNIGGTVKIDLNGDGDTDDDGETFTAQNGLKIGTTGTSYVDGNVFGGGRGFSGEALTAGSTGGNATVTIAGGTMLGSIYGGGRLASVGIGFTPASDPSYGQLIDDDNTNTHGHITVNISGGTIGNDVANAKYGGNVFGGSMGRITLLDGTLNPIWPKQAVTKDTEITITGNALIKRNVYGGSEYGIVRDKAIVNIGGTRNQSTGVVTASGNPIIDGSVYGGGYGSDDTTPTLITAGEYATGQDYIFTPMIWTGCVSGDTEVNIAGGTVKKNVYGGGEVASVGLINCHVEENENGDITIGTKKYRYTNLTKHDDIQGTGTEEKAYGFALSWPYKFEYISADPKSDHVGGKATVNVTGGHIGSTKWDDRTGYVFGGSKGQVAFKKKVGNDLVNVTDIHEQRYVEGLCANVRKTEVNVKYSSTPSDKTPSNIKDEDNCIMGAVYGGGEDGHVYEDAKVNITNGLIGLSVYGGGKGEGTYTGTKYVYNESTKTWTLTDNVTMPSWTAGKVYGNTSITMSNGHVMGNVYGGGNLGSVGKGNYAGGTDDYYPAGYGETLQNAPLWSATAGFDPNAEITESNKPTTMADYFLSSGKCKISITGGTVGTLNGLYGYIYGTSKGTPTGMVFGGSRGRAAQDVGALSPRYNYAPDFFLGYVNNTDVTIGTRNADTGPTIYSQVFGGARDGHVRGSAKVEVNSGTIGQTYAQSEAYSDASLRDYQRYHRGNVYGSGSGLGTWDGTHHGTSSGSVTRNTTVDIYGGTIYNNVYGGGAMATVGPPKIANPNFAPETWSKCTVNIYGGTIGQTADYEDHKYGGCVYGASRGNRGGTSGDLAGGETIESYATVLWTQVNINGGNLAGNVYGGAKGGLVWKDTEVNLQGGTVAHNAYGGGEGTRGANPIEANVGGNTTVKLNEDKGTGDNGCIVEKVFGCNDLNGSPKGHALVHVYATQHKGTTKIVPAAGKHKKFDKLSNYKIDNYSTYTFDGMKLSDLASAAGINTSTAPYTTYTGILGGSGTTAEKQEALDNLIELIADAHYDVKAVYGGGDLAMYEPTDPTPDTPLNDTEEYAEVIIDGCDLTSIGRVYGGGNAASTPATKVRINAAYEIHEAFGGGNGNDNYQIDGAWYVNPGANVGYKATFHHNTSASQPYPIVENNGSDGYDNATTKEARIANYSYGKGSAVIEITGGRIHRSYGGSNKRGNIRYEVNSSYEESGACPMEIDEATAVAKDAETDGDIHSEMGCVDYMEEFYGGSTSGDVNSDIVLNITNGTFGKVFGGNKKVGRINGSITINVREEGCKPIIIGGLYAGGNEADYSIYGYETSEASSARTKAEWELLSDKDKAASPIRKDPRINVISATRIDSIYGGGYKARVVGNPHVNVNMEEGTLLAKYMKDAYLSEQTDAGTGVKWICRYAEGDIKKGILPIGTIGNVFGGGDQANVDGNTCVEIGTGKHYNDEGEEVVIKPARNAAFIRGRIYGGKNFGQGRVYGGGNLGDVTGNTTVEMGNGYVYDRIYGGGKEGNVGTISTTSKHTGDDVHAGCIGKPTAFAANTGMCAVTVSGGYVGPFAYSYPGAVATATITPMTMQGTGADGVNGPDDYGYVFGAGRGELKNPATDKDIDFRTYVDSTVVTISDSALIAGGVYGGAENGRVLRNTHVNIQGGQIGLGANKTAAYAEADFIDPTTATAEEIATKAAAMPECAAWQYGKSYSGTKKWLPYDEHADESGYDADAYGEADGTGGSDGHTFYGNVFGGGSGYFTYPLGDGKYEWLMSAGLVEGNTYVDISGGHILTNVYGGNEMTNVTGTAHVTMTGGTLGVPRTLAQIADHPVTCYLFGAGKGDERAHFNKKTNVGHAKVNVSGGIIYGSVFGGGEDGHVLGDVTMNISDVVDSTDPENPVVTSSPKIGTWGTSYVDGNVFGGGRGFSGDAYTAGNVAGSVTLNISGGTMLGSVYGGGRLGSVGYGLFDAGAGDYGKMMADNVTESGFAPPGGFSNGRGHIVVNISGDNTIIGNKYEFVNVPTNVATADLATWQTTNHVPQTTYESTSKTVDETTTYTHRLLHTRGGNVYVGGMGRDKKLDGTPISTYDESGKLTSPIEWKKLGNVKSTKLTITGNPWIMGNIYGGGEFGAVQGNHNVLDGEGNPIIVNSNNVVTGTEINITGGTIGTEITTSDPVKETVDVPTTYPTTGNSNVQYTFGSVFGGGTGSYEYVNNTSPVSDAYNLSAYIADSTRITLTNAIVRASVYGGGELGAVGGSTNVTINGTTEIGRNEVWAMNSENHGYVKYGGWRMGNVYGGGRGHEKAAVAGVVKGNTNINIRGGKIYHMVYGGGALASVGTFDLSDGEGNPAYMPIAGIPYRWHYTNGEVMNPAVSDGARTPTGTATVNIKGGTIGISGRDNGLVFGGSRGDISDPNVYYTAEEIAAATTGQPAYGKTTNDIKNSGFDQYLRVAWVNKSVVNIGTPKAAPSAPNVLTSPLIKGAVYGGAENGHNYASTVVNVNSGTIGITEKIPGTSDEDPWWDFGSSALNEEYYTDRGNVYGAGSGADTYTDRKGNKHYNPKTGMVGGTSVVNIRGGHVVHNVYGAGSMASLGNITNANDTVDGGSAKHKSETSSFALSWPYNFEFAPNTGKAIVNIMGGHIGIGGERIVGKDNGNIYGGSRGMAGERYTTAHFAIVNESQVTINFPYNDEDPSTLIGSENYAKNCIEGSVFGGGENGHVMGDTYVTLKDGFVSHSMFGGGRGEGKYKGRLMKVGTGPGRTGAPVAAEYTVEKDIYDWTAGKVYGNTHLTIVDGRILNNVLGGGYMASVGKGNFASGSDDFYSTGYGETLNGAAVETDRTLWDKGNANSRAFWNSGNTYVNVFGGEIGSMALWDDLPAGNIFGGCRGMAAPNLRESYRYLYNPEWLNGYTNETHVTIGGGYECKLACTDRNDKDHAAGELLSLDELQDMFAGTAFLDEDNMPVEANWTALSGAGPKIYGSVYGGAQDGRVRRDANVSVYAGEIGVPYTSANKTIFGTSDLDNAQWLHRGNVYGAGSGISMYKFDANGDGDTDDLVDYYEGKLSETGYSQYSGTVLRFTNVDILGGTIHRNVYGGGSMGSVGPPTIPPTRTEAAYKPGTTTRDAAYGGGTIGQGWWSQNTINIGGGNSVVTIGTPTGYDKTYGGEVYGACRGMSTLNPEQFATSVWTKVNIFDKATIRGNVYGGGDNGIVKKDSEVRIGDVKQ